MKHATCVLLFFAFCTAASVAQDIPRYEIFGGYAMERLGFSDVDSDEMSDLFGELGVSGNFSANKFLKKGFGASFMYNATATVGIEADFGWNSGDILKGTLYIEGNDVTLKAVYSHFTFLAGPRVALRKSDAVIPFAHVLIGLDRARMSLKATFLGDSESMDVGTDSAIGVAAGGGLDVKLNKSFALRLVQADYFYTRHWDEGLNNLRLAFGVVARF